MINSILAGFMIAVGAIVNLIVGAPLGPFLFAVGLLAILECEFSLFTGKAGLLPTKEISVKELTYVWLGNLLGTAAAALLISMTPAMQHLLASSSALLEIRLNNDIAANIILGIFCGVLMYLAVNQYKWTGSAIFAILPVAVFIFSGYNHCVADMFYTHLSSETLKDYLHLFPTTLGNIIGCGLIPMAQKIAKH